MSFFRVWLINIILLAVFITLAIQAAGFWTAEKAPSVAATSSGKEKIPAQPPVSSRKSEQSAAYDMIAEKTLFSEKRLEFLPDADGSGSSLTQSPQSPHSVLLYGTIIMKENRRALVRENDAPGGPDRWVREGDEIDGMTVREIQKERLLLSSDDKTVEVFLYDPQKPKSSFQLAKTGVPTIITASPETDAPSRQKADLPKRKDSESDKTDDPPVNAASEKSDTKDETPQIASKSLKEMDNEPSQAIPVPRMPQQKNRPESQFSEEQAEFVQTPFGKIMRKAN